MNKIKTYITCDGVGEDDMGFCSKKTEGEMTLIQGIEGGLQMGRLMVLSNDWIRYEEYQGPAKIYCTSCFEEVKKEKGIK